MSNIYAPTQCYTLDQNYFILKAKKELAPFANENLILRGDLNFYLNPKLDNIDSMSLTFCNPVYTNEVKSSLELINLTDCFMNFYTNLRYTWHSRGKSMYKLLFHIRIPPK